jgi:hypothetical protein
LEFSNVLALDVHGFLVVILGFVKLARQAEQLAEVGACASQQLSDHAIRRAVRLQRFE